MAGFRMCLVLGRLWGRPSLGRNDLDSARCKSFGRPNALRIAAARNNLN